MEQEVTTLKVKCPCCNRHLEEVKAETATLLRKCKSCRNNIFTEIKDSKIVINNIDHKSNNRDIIKPNWHKGAIQNP